MSNEEIKNELIRRGFTQGDSSRSVYIELGGYRFTYNPLAEALVVTDLALQEKWLVSVPTLDRIEALVFGLTGQRI